MSSKHSPRNRDDWYSIDFSAPWQPGFAQKCMSFTGGLDENPALVDSIERLMMDRTRVHEAYIREQAQTERLRLLLATVLFIGACLVIVFAPAGREAASHWVGAALVVAAGGVAGYSRVWGKSNLAEFGAEGSQKQLGPGGR